MGPVQVRPATLNDAEAIATVHVRSWQSAYRGLMPDDLLDSLSVERRAAAWRSIMKADAGWNALLVLEDGEGIEGFAHLCAARFAGAPAQTGEITAIYLEPALWGRGAGRALMDAAVQCLAEEGFTEAILWVLVGNERARRFYEAAGWACDGTEKSERVGVAGGTSVAIVETRYRRSL
jgi:GNAT superfamily N-acetyltransferase